MLVALAWGGLGKGPTMNIAPSPPRSARFVVGLTGGMGSGKSFVADRFAQRHGITLVDADAISHSLTGPAGAAMPRLAAAFGPGIIARDGSLDRAAMRALAFDDEAVLRRLEGILHPMIRDESARRVLADTGPYVLSVVPLLVERGDPRANVDRILVIDCSEAEQVERVLRRNGLPREQILAILARQATRAVRLQAADDVIDNGATTGADLVSIDAQVDALHARYAGLAAAKALAAPA
jgi:dephospho-CoA kinase